MASLVFKPAVGKVEVATVDAGGPSSTLTTALTAGASTSALVVSSLPYAIAVGDFLAITWKGQWDLAVVATAHAASASPVTIAVNAFGPTFSFPVGSYVGDLVWPGSQRQYTFTPGVAQQVPVEDVAQVAAALAALQGNLAAAGTPTITVGGTTGGTATWAYKVVAVSEGGDTVEGAAGSNATGQTTLTGSNYMIIAQPTLPAYSTGWRVIRTTSGGTPASVNVDISGVLPLTTTTFHDTGIAGTAYTAQVGPQTAALVTSGPKDL